MTISKDLKDKRAIEQSESRHKTAKIITGLIPGGSSVYESFTALVQPLHEKRKNEWVQEVTLRLSKLENRNEIDLIELSKSEKFNTIITRATLIALQTHQKEKKEALSNIVTNSSIEITAQTIDFDLTNTLLSMIERFSSLHIYLLNLIGNLEEKAKENGVELPEDPSDISGSLVFKVDESLKDKEDIVNLCWIDIESRGLVTQRSMGGRTQLAKAAEPKLTLIGQKMLELLYT